MRLLFAIVTLALAQHEGHQQEPPPERPPPTGRQDHGQAGSLPPDQVEITVAPDRQQLIGVKVARVTRSSLSGTIRANAVVTPDEAREAHVHTKLMGWVQELFVSSVGQKVKKGDPLYSLYSQELYAAQLEYVRAKSVAPDLASAARERLLLWDVPADELRKIDAKGAQKAIVFRAPVDGTVVEKSVLKGHYVEPGAMLYRIADLSEVWIIANVYEYEVNRLKLHSVAEVAVQGVDSPVLAHVHYVYPTVDSATRTVRVRLVAQNLSGALRPNAFGTAELPTVSTDALWVPDSALIDTGTRKVVFISLEGGRFRPVTVTSGRRAEGMVEVAAGLKEGDTVVVAANFLLDSESRLRSTGTPTGHSHH